MATSLTSAVATETLPLNIVRITDVSPRDGLQNEARMVSTQSKADLVQRLLVSGVDEIELTSFVSAAWVPQLGDAPQLCQAVSLLVASMLERNPAAAIPLLSALVPNEKGLNAAFLANDQSLEQTGRALLGKISVFTAASETFCQRNINTTIEASLARFAPVIARAHAAGLLVRGYISCAFACPFEGAIAPTKVLTVANSLAALGVDEIDLGDTIGASTPESISALLECIFSTHPATGSRPITLHLHDTFGNAAGCVEAALNMGVRSFDSAVGGLGGCPYAGTPTRRAPGNINTHSIIEVCDRMGYLTHVNDLMPASAWAAGLLAATQTDA